jgi:hypothetical protein
VELAVAPLLHDDLPGEVSATNATIAITARALHVSPRANKELVLESKQHGAVFAFAAPPAGARRAGWGVDLVANTTPAGEATVDNFLALDRAIKGNGFKRLGCHRGLTTRVSNLWLPDLTIPCARHANIRGRNPCTRHGNIGGRNWDN